MHDREVECHGDPTRNTLQTSPTESPAERARRPGESVGGLRPEAVGRNPARRRAARRGCAVSCQRSPSLPAKDDRKNRVLASERSTGARPSGMQSPGDVTWVPGRGWEVLRQGTHPGTGTRAWGEGAAGEGSPAERANPQLVETSQRAEKTEESAGPQRGRPRGKGAGEVKAGTQVAQRYQNGPWLA